MKPKKYLVIPGYVISKSDGDRHFISSRRLLELYSVHADECFFCETDAHPRPRWYHERYPGLIELRPRFDGDYSLPKDPA